MNSDACKNNLPVLNIQVSDEEDDIGLTPLTRPRGTPLIIGTGKPRLRSNEIFAPPPAGKDGLHMQRSLSPSSSELLDKNVFTPRSHTLSRTVPEPLITSATVKFEDTAIEDLAFEPERLARLRRWILTIVIGMFTA